MSARGPAEPGRPPVSAPERLTSNGDALDVERLAAAVAERLAAASPPDALLDAAGAAALLGVPTGWVRQEARAERLPHVRLGRYVRFERDALLAWRRERARGPRPRRAGSGPVPAGADRP